MLLVVHVRFRNDTGYTRLEGAHPFKAVPAPGDRVPLQDRSGVAHAFWVHRAASDGVYGSFVSLENTIVARTLRAATGATLPGAVADDELVALDPQGHLLWPVTKGAELPTIGKLTKEQRQSLAGYFRRLTGADPPDA